MKVYELSFQKNIRDIGGMVTTDGHHIKYGHLIRGGVLVNLNEDDIETVKGFNLTDIIDFRSSDEFETYPDYHLDGVRMHSVPVLSQKTNEEVKQKIKSSDGNLLWFLEDNTSGFQHLVKVYGEFITTKEGIEAYKKFFDIILKDNRVTYFHCSQGKDRTGFAAYLLEIALGVSEEDAMNDYLYSNIAMEKRAEMMLRRVEYLPFYNEEYKQSLIDVFSTRVEYMNSAINAMKEHYGGTLNFIKNALGVDIDKLKSLYLE
ncbi:MAG: tyrosine-protein phosphatase [Bacilli bacterium]|nr:tyrosine-protein phosphatase [Bacilli bacterium]